METYYSIKLFKSLRFGLYIVSVIIAFVIMYQIASGEASIISCILIILLVVLIHLLTWDQSINFILEERNAYCHTELPVVTYNAEVSESVVAIDEYGNMFIVYYDYACENWYRSATHKLVTRNFKWIYKPEYLNN